MFYTFREIYSMNNRVHSQSNSSDMVITEECTKKKGTFNYSTVHNLRVHIEPFKLKSSIVLPKQSTRERMKWLIMLFFLTKHTFQQLIRIEC